MYHTKSKWKLRNRNNTLLLAAGLLSIVLIAVLTCGIYISRLKTTLYEDTNRYLDEISQALASELIFRLEADGINLTSAAAGIEVLSSFHAPEAMNFLKEECARYNYKRMGLADKNGINRTTDGYVVDVSKEAIFQHAISGQVSYDVSTSFVDQEKSLISAAPVYENGEIIGIINGVTPVKELEQSLSISTFHGDGFSQIIDADGNYIINSPNHTVPQNANNFFDGLQDSPSYVGEDMLADMRENLQKGKSGQISYITGNGISRTANYIPLGHENWFLLSVVPTSTVYDKVLLFIRGIVQVAALLIFLFLILIAIALQIQRKSQKQLEKAAFEDPVTGGINRTMFELCAAEAIRKEPADTYVLISTDINHFKAVNDMHGSRTGNRLLKDVYQSISASLLEDEYTARISADIFHILLKFTSQEEITARLNQIHDTIIQTVQNRLAQNYVSLCSGVYLITEPFLDMISIEDRANIARKTLKEQDVSGFSSIAFYENQDRLTILRDKTFENNMEAALANRHFTVFLQPKVSLHDNRIAGAEALVRWQSPDAGVIPPGEFIPLFERNGFILKLDLYVFEEVCRMIRGWIDSGIQPVPVSVNLSRVHFSSTGFLDEYCKIRDQYEIPTGLIELEITESVIIHNTERVVRLVQKMHDNGFCCSMDDFGSGYSSLNILKDLPVDAIKLDRIFFKAASGESERGAIIVRDIIELARQLHIKTVCEGVETVKQVEFLKSAHCEMVQGFVFSKPIPEAEFSEILPNRAPLTPTDFIT